MTHSKTEINLEVSTGFFRIATDNLVYSITVLSSLQSGPAPEALLPAVQTPAVAGASVSLGDDFYKQVSTDIFNDIGRLAKNLSSTIMALPVEDRKIKRADLDQAGIKIEDAKNQLRAIVSMTERATMEIMDHVEKVQNQTNEVRALLAQLKAHKAFLPQKTEKEEIGENAADQGKSMVKLDDLEQKLIRTAELLTASAGAPAEAVSGPDVTRKRFLFDLDIIFQTIYELCTNEAVKGHISSTRKNVADFFDYDVFVDTISLRIAELEPDGDNFYTIPLSVVLASLAASCSEKKIQNLLAKMKANQDEIFLDSALPLEAPPVVEELKSQVKAESADFPPMPVSTPPSFLMSPENNEKLNEARELIAEALLLFGVLRQEVDDSAAFVSCNGMIKEDQLDIFRQIENAFNMVSRIYGDVTRITEVLGFQDLSGQQILKIIKLLSDFQVQLLAIMVSFGSQLKSKERDTTVTPQESKRMAQEDVDHYFKTMTGDQDPEGPLDQDTVNKMLEDFGF